MSLRPKISLLQASALNMIDMVGIGPFVVTSSVMSIMGGPHAVIAWAAGALLAFLDAFVWAELGAAMPAAGGSYAFLRESYGAERWGKLMSFLFIWQTVFQSSFVVASGAIGFSNYFAYLVPLGSDFEHRIVSGLVVVLVVTALYRKVETLAKLSVILWVCVVGTILWIIIGGLTHIQPQIAFHLPENAFRIDAEWFTKLGNAMQSTVYAFLGYYNVCHLGSEIRNPERNIPRSIFISIAGIGILYILMQFSISAVIPAGEVHPFIVSTFIERLYGPAAATLATVLVLIIALSSLFAVVLGYSRIPYAAAAQGNFFRVFASLHPTQNFPHVSLLFIGGLSLAMSVVFLDLKFVVAMILTMRILTQFVAQSIGLVIYRNRVGSGRLPFRMLFYPLPILCSVAIWLWLFGTRKTEAILGGIGMTIVGIFVYLSVALKRKWFPFGLEPNARTEDVTGSDTSLSNTTPR